MATLAAIATRTDERDDDTRRLACPFCRAFEVQRLYLASVRLDACACSSCGARWEEDAVSGVFRGRSSRSSIVLPRQV